MAVITPVRPKWMRRDMVVVYVADGQMRARSRASRIHNPRTKRQQANRSKMGMASRFLRDMQPLVAAGFTPTYTERNGRKVGAYHVALGLLMREAMRHENGRWYIDYPEVQLAQGRSLTGYTLEARRTGRTLHLNWTKGLPQGTLRVRIGLHSPEEGKTFCIVLQASDCGRGAEVQLPKWATGKALHLWWMVEVKGRHGWASQHLLIAKDRGTGHTAGGGRSAGRGIPYSWPECSPAHTHLSAHSICAFSPMTAPTAQTGFWPPECFSG